MTLTPERGIALLGIVLLAIPTAKICYEAAQPMPRITAIPGLYGSTPAGRREAKAAADRTAEIEAKYERAQHELRLVQMAQETLRESARKQAARDEEDARAGR